VERLIKKIMEDDGIYTTYKKAPDLTEIALQPKDAGTLADLITHYEKLFNTARLEAQKYEILLGALYSQLNKLYSVNKEGF
jgi:hypothetical protein